MSCSITLRKKWSKHTRKYRVGIRGVILELVLRCLLPLRNLQALSIEADVVVMETMPVSRVMNDMIILPNDNVLIINRMAMHMQLVLNDRVVVFDRTDFGLSKLSLPKGKWRDDPYEQVVKVDYTAHSFKYDVALNTFHPVLIQTDVWCSSAALFFDGRLV
ncbi:aldehyde oxidase GLOX-like [Senna tora]|uniref:Aldehyde oxidase GLOX-like n=1 Tax=Senna tora TaxID=362788 RepID=A0A834X3R3_9FABA|nr:aldehyde oxidase GLOX-like [Senna tora]